MITQSWNSPKFLGLSRLQHHYSRLKFAKVTWLFKTTSRLIFSKVTWLKATWLYKAEICPSYLTSQGYITVQSWTSPKLLDLSRVHHYSKLKFAKVPWLIEATSLLKAEIHQSSLTYRGYITTQSWNSPKLPDFSRLHQGWYFPKLLDLRPLEYTKLICPSYLTSQGYITVQSWNSPKLLDLLRLHDYLRLKLSQVLIKTYQGCVTAQSKNIPK